nr:PAS domain S-box protein [uncultured Carboxylicivirga sp.]
MNDKEAIRRKVIGLGDESVNKSYYPQLQQYIHELEHQKEALELKTIELNKSIKDLQETKNLLEASENKFRELFENANDAIFIYTIDNVCIDCNTKAIKLTHFESKQELLGLTPIDISPKYQANGRLSIKELEKLRNRVINGKPQLVEWIIRKKNNDIVYCEVSLSEITIGSEQFVQAIVRDITEFKKLERNFSMATIRTEEKERLRFAKELHDGIGPILSTIKLYLQWLNDTDNEEHIQIIKQKIGESITEATKAIKEVSHNLSPHVLTNYGLIEALDIFIKRIKDTGKLKVELKNNLSERLNKDLEIMFYRVCTELINNTLKHANATKAIIKIKIEDDIINFTYSDNGIGLPSDFNKLHNPGMGFNNIINRIKSVGGVSNYNHPNHKGFKIKITVANIPNHSINNNSNE